MRIFGGDVGQFDGRLHHVLDSFRRKIRCIGSPGLYPDQDAQARPRATRLLSDSRFPHPHVGGELLALCDGTFGVSGAQRQRLLHYVSGQFQ